MNKLKVDVGFRDMFYRIHEQLRKYDFSSRHLDKGCVLGRDGPLKYTFRYEYRESKIESKLTKQNDKFVFVIDVEKPSIHREKNFFKKSYINNKKEFINIENFDDELNPLINTIRNQIDQSSPSNLEEHGDNLLPQNNSNTLTSSISTSTMAHPSIMTTHANQKSYHIPTANNNNYFGQIDEFSQGGNNRENYWNTASGDFRSNNNTKNSQAQWSTGNNGGLSSMSGNRGVYGTSGNPVSSSSLPSFYQQNQGQSMYNLNGLNQQGAYPHSNHPNHLRSPYGLSSSQSSGNVYGSRYRSLSQPTENIYGSGYPSSSSTMIPPNDIQSSSAPSNQYAPANLPNGQNQTNYDRNMYYASYYPHLPAQQYYPQQQATVNQSQSEISLDQTTSSNGFTTSSNGGLDQNYQHLFQ